jgi:hypothetical protein
LDYQKTNKTSEERENTMSRQLQMTVKNLSNEAIDYSVTHVWDSNADTNSGKGLSNQTGSNESAGVIITSGFSNYDWYTVVVTFYSSPQVTRSQHFYCNSSSGQDAVVIEVFDSHVHCKYYIGGTYDTGCKDKGWD